MKPSRALASSRRSLRASSVLACAAVPLFAFGTLTFARSVPTPESVPPAVEAPAPTAAVMQRGGISLDQAIRIASERYPGRVVRAETTMRGGRVVHEVRILMEGDGNARMRIVRIDAETGRFL